MTTDYNQIAQEYKKSKFQPWRLHAERHMLMTLLGDLTGKSVLDIACGEGFYSRQLKQAGAAKVLGVDISSGMIELAVEQEARLKLGNQYLTGDCTDLNLAEKFDLILAAYFINYARSREELSRMAHSMARHLKPGGRLVMVNNNVMHDPNSWPQTASYGFVKKGTGQRKEGEPITYEFHLDTGAVFSLDNYYIDPEVQETTLKAAGFKTVEWFAPEVDGQGLSQFGPDYWQTFLTDKPVIFNRCTV